MNNASVNKVYLLLLTVKSIGPSHHWSCNLFIFGTFDNQLLICFCWWPNSHLPDGTECIKSSFFISVITNILCFSYQLSSVSHTSDSPLTENN